MSAAIEKWRAEVRRLETIVEPLRAKVTRDGFNALTLAETYQLHDVGSELAAAKKKLGALELKQKERDDARAVTAPPEPERWPSGRKKVPRKKPPKKKRRRIGATWIPDHPDRRRRAR